MINSKRLSKIIQTRENQKIKNHLIDLYARLSDNQKSAINRDMQTIKNEKEFSRIS